MTISDGLLAHLQESARVDAAGIEEVLSARLAGARKRWPAIKLDDATFLAHLWPADSKARRAPDDPASLAALHLEDLFLAVACASGDRAALAELETSVLSCVPRVVQRFQGVHAEDVKQELRQKLLLPPSPRLLDYTGRGALERWVGMAASRCAIDLQRQLKSVDQSDPIEMLLAGPDPEIDFVKVHDREALRGLLQEAVRALPAGARLLLRLHYLEALSLEKLATLQRVHTSTIKRRLSEARGDALEAVRKLLRERLKLTDDEGASLVRLLESRLDLSLRSAFSISRPP